MGGSAIDCRLNPFLVFCSSENFKVGCDWARVSFSRDISRVAAGSNDGHVFIWNINGQLEATLRDNT